jgi:AcrR family transcriptional regulator
MEDVAARAGVAVPTVYKAFTNKRTLLRAAVVTAMTGGPDAPVDRQAWFHEQLGAPTAELQLQLIARNARRLNDRAAPLLELVRATAARDSGIAAPRAANTVRMLSSGIAPSPFFGPRQAG